MGSSPAAPCGSAAGERAVCFGGGERPGHHRRAGGVGRRKAHPGARRRAANPGQSLDVLRCFKGELVARVCVLYEACVCNNKPPPSVLECSCDMPQEAERETGDRLSAVLFVGRDHPSAPPYNHHYRSSRAYNSSTCTSCRCAFPARWSLASLYLYMKVQHTHTQSMICA